MNKNIKNFFFVKRSKKLYKLIYKMANRLDELPQKYFHNYKTTYSVNFRSQNEILLPEHYQTKANENPGRQ